MFLFIGSKLYFFSFECCQELPSLPIAFHIANHSYSNISPGTVRKALGPFTLKISLVILLTFCYTIHMMLVQRIW